MVKENAIIVWHDYRSKIHEDVTKYIDELSKDKKIVYVQNTMLALHFLGKYHSLIV